MVAGGGPHQTGEATVVGSVEVETQLQQGIDDRDLTTGDRAHQNGSPLRVDSFGIGSPLQELSTRRGAPFPDFFPPFPVDFFFAAMVDAP